MAIVTIVTIVTNVTNVTNVTIVTMNLLKPQTHHPPNPSTAASTP